MNHFEGAGSGEGGGAVGPKELARGDAHDRGRALGASGENRVSHGFVDLRREAYRNGLVKLHVHLSHQESPVRLQVKRTRNT